MPVKKSSSQNVNWLVFWVLVLCSVALVASIFGNVDVRTLRVTAIVGGQATVVESLPKITITCEESNLELRTKVQRLESEVESLKIFDIRTSPITKLLTSTSSASGDGRKFVSSYEIYLSNSNPLFFYEWNSATATRTAIAKIPEAGIQFDAPYNDKWGNPYFAVEPLELNHSDSESYSYAFGPISIVHGEGGAGHFRQYRVSPDPKGDITDAVSMKAFITERMAASSMWRSLTYTIQPPQTIHGLLVLRVDTEISCEDAGMGFCGPGIEYYVLGPKGIVHFSNIDWFPLNVIEFQNIIRSVRPI